MEKANGCTFATNPNKCSKDCAKVEFKAVKRTDR